MFDYSVVLLIIVVTIVMTSHFIEESYAIPENDSVNLINTQDIADLTYLNETGPYEINILRAGKTNQEDEKLSASSKLEALNKIHEILLQEKTEKIKITENSTSSLSLKIPYSKSYNHDNRIIYILITAQ